MVTLVSLFSVSYAYSVSAFLSPLPKNITPYVIGGYEKTTEKILLLAGGFSVEFFPWVVPFVYAFQVLDIDPRVYLSSFYPFVAKKRLDISYICPAS